MPARFVRSLLSLSLLGATTAPVVAQGAVDPSIAPRAMQLARSGERIEATELLGRYLATAPDDGGAWRALGWFYLLDSREWHHRGHTGDPPGALFLDFAAAALDQALRAPTDSARLLRAVVEVERLALEVERSGWALTRAAMLLPRSGEGPAFLLEAGTNLAASCPVGGVLVTGSDLEAAAVWNVVFASPERGDLVLLLPVRYGEDSLYRRAMAEALEVAPGLSVSAALTETARRRPVCLTPGVPREAAPALPLAPLRLLQVAGPDAPLDSAPLRVVDLLQAELTRPGPVEAEVLALYRRAAQSNPLLCSTLLLPLGVHQRTACHN
jgi:hypothetical protein